MIGKTLGQYEIREELGRGGMATVYKAYQPNLDRFVAIKVMSTALARDTGFLERFRREARSVARLHHPNILAVYDFGEEEGSSYIVMEYIQGGTLKDRLGRPLDFRTAASILTQVAGALDHAHSQGIVHRDIKPSNIMVTEDGRAVLSDFGIARMADTASSLTAAGMVIGTPEYMSPEQGQGIPVDRRSDVYSLGVVVYEMLTAQVPFSATSTPRLLYKHIYEPLPSPRQINPSIPPQIESVVMKALAKRPEERFQTAGEFARAFQNAVEASLGAFDVRRTMAMFAQNQPPPPPAGPARPPTAGGLAPPPVSPYAQPGAPGGAPPPPVSPYVTPGPPSAPAGGRGRRRGGLIAGIVAGSVALLCCLGIGGFLGLAAIGARETPTPDSGVVVEPTLTTRTPPVTRSPLAASPTPRQTGRILFEDKLDTNKNDWAEDKTQNQSFFQEGKYHLVSRNTGKTYRAWPGNAPRFDNFAYEVTAQKIEGSDDFGYGLVFRDAGNSAFYVFEVNGKGQYRLSKHTASNEWQDLTEWVTDPAVRKGNGATNKLKVICNGNEIDFYVNDKFLDVAYDDMSLSGRIGLIVGTEGLHAAFSNLSVRSVAP